MAGMGISSPYVVVLTADEERALTAVVSRSRSEHRDRLRAVIVLKAACGHTNAAIAAQIGTSVDTVRCWRRRFAQAGPGERVAALADRARPGRPKVHDAMVRAQVVATACARPGQMNVPLARWSSAEIAWQVRETSGAVVSSSTVWRWLKEDAIKPWQYRSWISVRDPDFEQRAVPVLELYAGRWKGRRLRADEYVICADEKTSIQARCRCHPTLPPGRARTMRVEHEYDRAGSVAYLAAWDVHRGQAFGRCEATTGILPFERLVEQVMTSQPYASARRVFWIVDNGSSHRGQASIDRMRRKWPNAVLVHTPVHASWLNQCEIYFSVIQRKVVTPNDFTSTGQIIQRLAAFEARYNQIATPYQWGFTKTDLHNLLERIDRHENPEYVQAA
jgi:transposase